MAKHLTPIVGLAVVMALALAAVFGSMSLANPAWAQDANDKTITDLKVTGVAGTTVNLSWTVTGYTDANDNGDVAAEYQVRVEEMGDSSTRTAWVTGGGSAPFAVTTADDGHTVTAIITPTGPIALIDNTAYTFYIRNIDGGAGAAASIDATPNPTPGVVTLTATAAVSGSPGSVKLTWTYAAGVTGVEAGDVTGWEYRTAEYNTPPATLTDYSDDTLEADSESMWMALSGLTGEDGDDADPFIATVDGLDAKLLKFQVRAMNGQAVVADTDFTDGGTAADMVMVEENLAPVQLTRLMAEAGNGRLMVSWRTPSGNELQDITYYQSRHIETPADGMMPADDDDGWTNWDRLVPAVNTTADNLVNNFTITG
ncbi:MAG: hypothetical protein OXN21_03400, partial [Chloroflexota bacterium]|nr:hypothetical protein [Chloroflexota bacterium]